MYKCEKCGKISLNKEKRYSIVIKKRNVTYFIYSLIHKIGKRILSELTISGIRKDIVEDYLKKGFIIKSQKITRGWEISEEIRVCTKCKEKENDKV